MKIFIGVYVRNGPSILVFEKLNGDGLLIFSENGCRVSYVYDNVEAALRAYSLTRRQSRRAAILADSELSTSQQHAHEPVHWSGVLATLHLERERLTQT